MRQAKALGLQAAKDMSGFSVAKLDRWVRESYDCKCYMATSVIQGSMMNEAGELVPVPGHESTLLTLEIHCEFDAEHHDMQAEILAHLKRINASTIALGVKAEVVRSRLTLNMSFYMSDVTPV